MSYSYWTDYKYTEPGVVAALTPTDGTHIHFDANQHSGMGKDYPSARYMEIRGITYGASGHFHKWADGTWNLGLEKETEGYRNYNQLYMSRNGGGVNSATDAARRKAVEIMTRIVRQWVTNNPEALAEAEHKDTERKREKVRDRIAELQKQIDAATAEMRELDAQLLSHEQIKAESSRF